MKNKTRWDALSMRDRASLIKLYSQSGIRKLDDMRAHYNKFGEGGDKEGEDYNTKLEKYDRARSDVRNAIIDRDKANNALWDFSRNYKGDRVYWYWTDKGKRLKKEREDADLRLRDAEKELDVARNKIGNATLDKFAGTAYDPMYFWEFVHSDRDKARKYYVDRGIRQSERAQEVIDFFNSYGSSEGFSRIRENQKNWWLKRHPYRKIWQFGPKTASNTTNWLQDRMRGLNNGTAAGIYDLDTYTETSVMRSGNGHGAITVGTIESPEQPYLFALPHEIAHITNSAGFATPSGSVQAEALEQNINTQEGHDSRPSEKHSDIEALRYLLFKEGIYDSRGNEDATAEDIKKLREKYPKIRPLLQMDDEQAAWMINHVAAVNEKVDMSNIAAHGGSIHNNRFDTGGDKVNYRIKGHDWSMWTPSQVQEAIDWGVAYPEQFFGEEGAELRDRLSRAGMADSVIGSIYSMAPREIQETVGDRYKSTTQREAEYASGITSAIDNAGKDIYNIADTITGFMPGPIGGINWGAHMTADALAGNWGKVAGDVAMAGLMGLGATAVSKAANKVRKALDVGKIDLSTEDIASKLYNDNFSFETPKRIVNSDGSINSDMLLGAYRDVLRYVNANSPGPKLRMNEIYGSSGKSTSLRQHLEDVVKTAQEIPVPKGSSREELVRSALVHDIGKVIKGQEGSHPEHGIAGSRIIKELGKKYPEFSTDHIRSAVGFHMYDDWLKDGLGTSYGKHGIHDIDPVLNDYQRAYSNSINYDLVHALQAADVARGLSYDEAASRFPQLFTYLKENPVNVTLYQGTEQEQLDKVINPILKRYGYQTIKNGEDASLSLYEKLRRHRSFIRGVRDPKNASTITKEQAALNLKNAEESALSKYGVSTPETRAAIAITDIPKAPTGYRRASLFEVDHSGPIAQYTPEHGNLSSYLKVDPKSQDALYVSASPELLRTYASREFNNIEGMPAKVTLPLEFPNSTEDLVNLMERGEFQLYNGKAITSSRKPMSDWQLYEEPYRLQTGRSLQEDMKKAYKEAHPNSRIATYKSSTKLVDPTDVHSNVSLKYLADFNNTYPEFKQYGIEFNPYKEIGDKVLINNTAISHLRTTMRSLRTLNIADLHGSGLVSDKQYDLYKKVVNEAKQAFVDKYITASVLKKIKKRYYEDVKIKNKIVDPEFTAFMKDKIGFMRKQGVVPLYEMPSFGKTEMFSTNKSTWGNKPKTRNFAPTDDASQAIIIGNQGDTVFDLEKVFSPQEIIDMTGPNYQKLPSGRRDAGHRSVAEDPRYAITRKTYATGGDKDTMKNLAYKIGAYVHDGAGATPFGLLKAVISPQQNYDELKAYLWGPENAGFEPYTGTSTKPYLGNNVPTYNATINPNGQYVFPENMKGFIEEVANRNGNIYLNADLMPGSDNPRYDAANYPVNLFYDNKGNISGNAADLYDFGINYSTNYKTPKWQIKAMRKQGIPYAVRQDNIPFVFSDSPEAENTVTAFSYGEMGNKNESDKAIINAMSRLGNGTIEPASITFEYPERLENYASGGKIHIKPENRGKFTALKKRTGKTASWFKAHGTPAQKKMAIFALNAAKWHKK